MARQKVVDRFRMNYNPMSEETSVLILRMKQAASDLEMVLDEFPDNRECAIALTNLETTVLWATKAITGV